MRYDIHDIRNRIADAELASWRSIFLLPQTPKRFAERVSEFHELVGDHAVDSPRAGFWRDAYLASAFATFRQAELVHLLEAVSTQNGKQPPDCQLLIEAKWERYELVEVLLPGRRRSDEFREDREVGGGSPRPDRIPDKRELRDIVRGVADRKAVKAPHYDRVDGLVMSLSVWAWESEEDLGEAFTEGTRLAGNVFHEVWIMSSDVLRRIWTGGHEKFERIPPDTLEREGSFQEGPPKARGGE